MIRDSQENFNVNDGQQRRTLRSMISLSLASSSFLSGSSCLGSVSVFPADGASELAVPSNVEE